MRVVPVQTRRMVGRHVKLVTVALTRLYGNVRRVRIVRADRVKHVHRNVEAVQVQIGRIEPVRHVRWIDLQ